MLEGATVSLCLLFKHHLNWEKKSLIIRRIITSSPMLWNKMIIIHFAVSLGYDTAQVYNEKKTWLCLYFQVTGMDCIS